MSDQRAEPKVSDFTVEQVERSIEQAMTERNFEMVVALIKVMAVKDLDRANLILRSIKAGLSVAVERAAAEVDGATADAIEEAREAVRAWGGRIPDWYTQALDEHRAGAGEVREVELRIGDGGVRGLFATPTVLVEPASMKALG